MEKYTDILEKIKQISESIRALEEKRKALLSGIPSGNFPAMQEALKAVDGEYASLSQQETNLKIERKILQGNVRVAMFREVLPAALEILGKYNGKPYGEKTKRKISEEVKQRTGCSFYIESEHCTIRLDLGGGHGYTVRCGLKPVSGESGSLLINNKIQPVSADRITLYYIPDEYVEDVSRHVENLKAAYAEVVAKQKEMEEACKRYNALAVGDINSIYPYQRMPEKMEI